MSVVTRERTIEPPLDSSTNSAQLSVVHVFAVHICKSSLMCAQSKVHTALLQGSRSALYTICMCIMYTDVYAGQVYALQCEYTTESIAMLALLSSTFPASAQPDSTNLHYIEFCRTYVNKRTQLTEK